MGFKITKQEIDYPMQPLPQGYRAQDNNLGSLLAAMFRLGKKKSMTGKRKPIVTKR